MKFNIERISLTVEEVDDNFIFKFATNLGFSGRCRIIEVDCRVTKIRDQMGNFLMKSNSKSY